MQTNVNEILAAASLVNDITKASGRALRETDEYPFFYVGGRLVPQGDNDVQDTAFRSYNQGWNYLCQLYVKANTDNDRETNYSDYESAESITDEFLGNLLGNGDWELVDLDYYPAVLGGIEIIVTDITLKKYHTSRY